MANRTGTDRGETLVGTPGADTISARGGADTLRGLGGNDRLLGEAGDDRILGGDGNDRLEGGIGLDSLFGEAGNDLLIGGPNADFIDGGAGRDTVDYGDIASPRTPGQQFALVVDLEAQTARGANGPDALRGIENASGSRFGDLLIGDDGDSVLIGREGDDGLDGENGSDRLLGGAGDDFLRGEAGDDRLLGGIGDDFMRGGTGDDVFVGGAGRDVFDTQADSGDLAFLLEATEGRDVLADFVRGDDTLVFAVPGANRSGFAELDSNANGVLDDGDRFVRIERVTHAGATRLSTVLDLPAEVVPDAPAGAEFTAVVFGVTGLTAADVGTAEV